MSIRAQIAFGKNLTLQKQLEDKYLNLRRSFRHSRRRLDTTEEECVAALYKLLLYAREKQGLSDAADVNIFNDLLKKPKSAGARRSQSVADMHKTDENVARRPATAMAGKTYTQSFSFIKDGLNIDKTRRDRFMRTKAEKERMKDDNVKVERLTDNWQTLKMNRAKTAVDRSESPDESSDNDNDTLPVRPKTAYPQANRKPEFKGLLSRPRTSNTLRTPKTTLAIAQRSSTPVNVSDKHAEILSAYSNTEDEDKNSEFSGNGTQTRSHTHGERLDSPSLTTVHEGRTTIDGRKSPLIVRITTTRLNDSIHSERMHENALQFRAESRLDNNEDEELIPLDEDDKNKLNELVNTDQNETIKLRASPSRQGTSSFLAPSRNASTPLTPDDNLLQMSAQKTQSFLTQYSKKSKVIGYVMKTRSSIAAPRERLISHRSPCITYQELASIKAGIKQHESKTRSLLQRSAKLSTYVDKLAKAGEMRKRLQELKENTDKSG
ncbi:uncharacterized protein LOC123543162 [Mercenaria mercenaria]|uniref:uncharacterized protein LOC123543162 n=1 Tax=Mercenaria mercenaria TaxID=6596 RepID=UPI00234E6180|nr:uncharacterized protein LOC123543162 [Mercenaria mercenaria]